ncbi:MAG: DUF2868 domain-containing protein, partial [Proteobacteria bacterium]|nr:DUF2868 domain-containing protein [Pseudomonadota bacterium]
MIAPSPLLTEAIRALEASGPLEDAQPAREAARAAGTDEGRIAHRAALLAARLGLADGLARFREFAPWVLLALGLVVTVAGLGLAGAVVNAGERRINVMAALVALLGAHLVSLFIWIVALAWPGHGAGGSLLGRLWLSATARLALGRGASASALAQAALALLRRAGLLPWLAGLASHLVWALAMAAALAALVFALSFRAYTLGWETTLLDPADFGRAVQALAVVPGWLGFAVPDIQAPTDRALAQWLLGCVVAYGLLPRILLALLCAAMWRARAPRMQPDYGLPYYRGLAARLQALAPAEVIDADTLGPLHAGPGHARDGGPTTDAALLAGFELPPDQAWPPQPMPAALEALPRVDGSMAQRQALLDTMARRRPRLLVLAVHASASPDRGAERLLREVLPLAGQVQLWPLSASASDAHAGEG